MSPVKVGELESFVSKHNSQFLPCNCMKLDKGVLQVAFFMCTHLQLCNGHIFFALAKFLHTL